MAALSVIWRQGIWISMPVLALGILLLMTCISGVIRTVITARLFSVPLVDRQEIEFTETGRVVLCIEGPIFTTTFRKLKYDLTGPNGMPVNGRIAFFRARTSGFSQVKMELKVYEITFPGLYVFKITGLDGERSSYEDHRIVFTRPHLSPVIAYIIGIVFAGMLIVGGIVLFFLRLISEGR